MAQAKRCNRCNTLYLPYRKKISGTLYNGVALIDMSDDGCTLKRGPGQDLCPACMESYVRWFTDGKTENTPEQV